MDEKEIKLTKKKLKELFEEYNTLYFNNEVQCPRYFELWTPSKNVVGWVRGIWNKKTQSYDAALHISNNFIWNKKDLKNTMIHEMIHLLIKDYIKHLSFWQKLFGKDHDKIFTDKMNELNTNFSDLNVVIRAKHMKNRRKK